MKPVSWIALLGLASLAACTVTQPPPGTHAPATNSVPSPPPGYVLDAPATADTVVDQQKIDALNAGFDRRAESARHYEANEAALREQRRQTEVLERVEHDLQEVKGHD